MKRQNALERIAFIIVLLIVATVRELFGAGSLFDRQVLQLAADGGWLTPNALMALPASAFFIIALVIWAVRSWKIEQREKSQYAVRV